MSKITVSQCGDGMALPIVVSQVGIAEMLVPMQVPSQNVRDKQHWRQRNRETKSWERWFRYCMRPGRLDMADGRRAVTITAYRSQRCRDIANLIGGCKGLIDALVRSGWIRDDSIKWAMFTYCQEVASKSPTGKPCTRIAISSVAP